ncbi:MAG: hypothetical protein G01um101491_78 [Parcubacteria group bacterium Gr01-1014_91]|nr:MAG: hypothetical protein G01um101491_78 [Parcubacteria group bacterium Gr01-1014_91]
MQTHFTCKIRENELPLRSLLVCRKANTEKRVRQYLFYGSGYRRLSFFAFTHYYALLMQYLINVAGIVNIVNLVYGLATTTEIEAGSCGKVCLQNGLKMIMARLTSG